MGCILSFCTGKKGPTNDSVIAQTPCSDLALDQPARTLPVPPTNPISVNELGSSFGRVSIPVTQPPSTRNIDQEIAFRRISTTPPFTIGSSPNQFSRTTDNAPYTFQDVPTSPSAFYGSYQTDPPRNRTPYSRSPPISQSSFTSIPSIQCIPQPQASFLPLRDSVPIPQGPSPPRCDIDTPSPRALTTSRPADYLGPPEAEQGACSYQAINIHRSPSGSLRGISIKSQCVKSEHL